VDDKEYWYESQTRNGTPILVSENETKENSKDLFAAFIGWCISNKQTQKAKVTTLALFLKDFRAALKDGYGFKDKDGKRGKNLCENEGNSGDKAYFNCLKLNDDGKEAKSKGEEYINKYSLNTRRRVPGQNNASTTAENINDFLK
jgi:hypothetical protein